MNKLDFDTLPSPICWIFFGEKVFLRADFTSFFEVSVLLFLRYCSIFVIVRSSLLTESTLKINEICTNIQLCNVLGLAS